ncbi:hypothetical protein N7448_005728 [Penicillium atrosanguineum]|nr:hypothetical protein N7448_005728 [Penicillium atrosanguineum]
MNSQARELPSADLPTRKRKRTACQPCRDRRVKCDNGRPNCQACCTLKQACVYPDESASKSTSYDPGSVEILHQLEGIRAILDQVARAQHDSGTASLFKSHSIPESVAKSNDSYSTPAGYSPRGQDRGREHGMSGTNGRSALNVPSVNAESLLHWPKVIEVLGTPVVERSFLLECTLDMTPASAPESQPSSSQYGMREDDYLPLCQRFLDEVHVRNPILEPNDLKRYAKEVTENGLKWDNKSCLVLLACALSCFAVQSPKEKAERSDTTNDTENGLRKEGSSYAQAKVYYQTAQKRIGYLGTSLLDIQCLYLAGIYEKHTLGVLQAWFWIEQACSRLHAYILCKGRPTGVYEENERRLEQRLYCSCVKAEGEFSSEIPLARSALVSLDYPDPFPSPPTLPAVSSESPDIDTQDILFSKSQEQSWLYYLAEIALRRTLDRALPIVYLPEGPSVWMESIEHILQLSNQIDGQLSAWYDHLPPAIRPSVNPQIQPSHQLSFFIQGRFLGARESILRQFLYYALHNESRPMNQVIFSRANEYLNLIRGLIIHLSKHERHGALWFVLRGIWSLSIVILTTVHAQIDGLHTPTDWPELVRISSEMLRAWSSEAADIRLMYETLVRAHLAICREVGISAEVAD